MRPAGHSSLRRSMASLFCDLSFSFLLSRCAELEKIVPCCARCSFFCKFLHFFSWDFKKIIRMFFFYGTLWVPFRTLALKSSFVRVCPSFLPILSHLLLIISFLYSHFFIFHFHIEAFSDHRKIENRNFGGLILGLQIGRIRNHDSVVLMELKSNNYPQIKNFQSKIKVGH